MKPGINNAIQILLSIITNKIFYVTFFTWFLAQALKIIINLSRTGNFAHDMCRHNIRLDFHNIYGVVTLLHSCLLRRHGGAQGGRQAGKGFEYDDGRDRA